MTEINYSSQKRKKFLKNTKNIEKKEFFVKINEKIDFLITIEKVAHEK